MVLKFGVRILQKSIDTAGLNLRCGLGRGLRFIVLCGRSGGL